LVTAGGFLIALALFIVLAATVYTLMLPKIYRSHARISVVEDAPEINPFSDQEQYAAYNPYFLRTQFETIQSPPVLNEVINRLNLQQEWGRDGEQIPREIALKILQNSVQVFQMRDTSLIVISVRRTDPDEAADIANELAETFRDYRLDEALKDGRRKIDVIEKAMKEQLVRVEAAEEKMSQLRVELNISSNPSEKLDDVRLQQLERERFAATTEMLEKEGLLQVLKDLEGKDVQEQASYITFDQVITNTLRQLQDVDVELATLPSEYGSNHPEVRRCLIMKKALEESLHDRLEALRNGQEEECRIAKNNLERLDQRMAEIRSTSIEYQSEKYRPFRTAESEAGTERFIYSQLKEKLQQETIALEVPRNPVEIIDVAEPNHRPVSPNLIMNVLIAMMAASVCVLPGVVLLIFGLKKR
jgi:uncharacterized protein involved in exopolysaccharide biosynthesis